MIRVCAHHPRMIAGLIDGWKRGLVVIKGVCSIISPTYYCLLYLDQLNNYQGNYQPYIRDKRRRES